MTTNVCVLGIDPGSESGAALLQPNERRDALVIGFQSEVKKSDALTRATIVRAALRAAAQFGVDLLIIREKWSGGQRGKDARATPDTLMGLGTAWGLWLEQIYMQAPFLPSNRIGSVYPATWRSKVLDAHAPDKDGWERVADKYVRERFNQKPCGPNAAAATCIALYGPMHPKLSEVIQDNPRWHQLYAEHEKARAALRR